MNKIVNPRKREVRTFPIQGGWRIPWQVAEMAYKQYVVLGHGKQSLQRVADRGGFGWVELIALLRKENPWYPLDCPTLEEMSGDDA